MAALTIPYSVAEARAQVRSVINESTADFWTDDEIDSWLVEGTSMLATQAHCVEAVDDVTLVVNQLEYTTLDGSDDVSDIIKIHAVIYNDGSNGYTGLVKMDLDLVGRDDLNSSGPPQQYCMFADKIVIMPITSAAVVSAGGKVRVYYSKLAADITSIPDHLQVYVICYAVAMAFFKRNKNGIASYFMNLFNTWSSFERVDLMLEPTEGKTNFIQPDILTVG